MGHIFITGDKHGSLELKHLSNKNWPLARELTKDDILIICGDAGFMWDDSNETKYWDDWCEERPFTILAALGNHENYTVIRALPLEEWNGGHVRKVRPHVMYAENGEIFTLNNQTFFFFGGASSVDKARRIEGKSWWPEEIASNSEMDYAAKNLEKYNMRVNHIVTHTAPNFILDKFWYEYDPVTNFLTNYIERFVQFDDWWFGHFHDNRNFGRTYNYHMLYHDIEEIK